MTNSALDPDDAPAWLAMNIGLNRTPGLNVLAGIETDDCAILEAPSPLIVLTTDYVNATPISLQLGLASMSGLGRYLVNANLADLCGSGARPAALLVSIMWNRSSPREEFEELMRGADSAASECSVRIIGGDTKLGSRSAYAATAIGFADDETQLFIKSRATPGDGVWVSGPLGSCAAAVLGCAMPEMSPAWRTWAEGAIVRPTLPLAISRKAASLRMGAAGTDISDGLGADLNDLCNASGVGVEITAEAIPLAPEAEAVARSLAVPGYRMAFTIGGDLQFLITASARYEKRLQEIGLVKIGAVHADPGHRVIIDSSDTRVPLPTAGHRDGRGLTFHEEIKYLLKAEQQ